MRERLMDTPEISYKEFERILPQICDTQISRYPRYWSPENPLAGTCIPVSLVAKRIFKGQLLRADLRPFPVYRKMYWHWANLIDGLVIDFTRAQFVAGYPKEMEFIEKPLSRVLRSPDVLASTELLYNRLTRLLVNNAF